MKRKRVIVRTEKPAIFVQSAIEALRRLGCRVDVYQGTFHAKDIKHDLLLPPSTRIKDLPIGTAFKMDKKRRIVTMQVPYEAIDDLINAHGLPLVTESRVVLRSHLMILQQKIYEVQREITELLDLVDAKKPARKKRRKR